MANAKSTTPALRFKGFDAEWEERPLKKVADKVVEKNINLQITETFTNSAEFGIISQRDYFDHDISNSDNIGTYYIVQNEDFVYNPRISTFAPVGPINRNKLGRSGVMSPLYTVFRPHDIDNTYLEQYFKGSLWHSFMKLNGDSGARSDRFSIKDSVFIEMPIPYPDLNEQAGVGNYFQNLDSLIALQRRKLVKLQNVKKALLQKMFPERGSTTPQIRFAGFTEPWEEQKLGDLADIVGGGTPSTSISEFWGGNIDWYSPAEIGEQTYVKNSRKKITAAGLKNCSARVLPVGTILFTSRAGIGNTAILAKSGATNQGFQSIIPHKSLLDSYFMFSRTHELKLYGETVGAGSTFIEVTGKQMANMPILIPTLPEQIKIGIYFKHLDTRISLQQRKLEKLQNLKKAFLGKMFV